MKYICIRKFHPYYHRLELHKIYIIEYQESHSRYVIVDKEQPINWISITLYDEQLINNFMELSRYRDMKINEIFN